MEKGGWVFNVDSSKNRYWEGRCGKDTWYGLTSGAANGYVQATFDGSGKGTLNYGNCYEYGWVRVYLNNVMISQANANIKNKMVDFQFSKGDVLKIAEAGIIKLNSLKIDCRGKTIMLEYE